MTSTVPHHLRVARALALLGGAVAVAGCAGAPAPSGSGGPAVPGPAAGSAGSAAARTAAAPNAICPDAPPTVGSACTGIIQCPYPQAGEPQMCTCVAQPDGRSKAWRCENTSAEIEGPLPPPDLPAAPV